MVDQNFIGTWELKEMVVKDDDKVISRPYGDYPLGYITYCENNFMHAILMNGKRRKVGLSYEDFHKPNKPWIFFNLKFIKGIINYFKASVAFAAYSGTYEIQENEIVHNVTSSFFPDWIGTGLVRTYEFIEDKLILSAVNNDDTVVELVWQRK